MIDVSKEFQPDISFNYPEDNEVIFEEWFYLYYDYSLKTSREYLPIMWTAYYVNNSFGQDKKSLDRLQTYLDALPRNKKYFTIIQYDDGILNDLKDLDILVFAMSTKTNSKNYIPIPLISYPRNYSYIDVKPTLVNFIGQLETHPIRKQMYKVFSGRNIKDFYITGKKHDIIKYCSIIKNSTFTLCPRGYGITSFRLAEALFNQSIPVYISDEHWLPFNLDFSYGLLVKPDELDLLPKKLENMGTGYINKLKKSGALMYQKYFTYPGCKKQILKQVLHG